MRRRNFLCGAAGMLGLGFTFAGRRQDNYFCGVRDTPNALRSKANWGREHLRYCIAGRDNDLSGEVWDKQFELAFDAWADVTPLTFEQVSPDDTYDIYISVSRRRREGFGRPGGTLAWAQLPSTKNFDGVLISKFDLAENWVLPELSEAGTVLLSVAAHEIGHLLGLDHSNDKDALMYPYINNALNPREDDIKKIRRLYPIS